MYRPRCATVRDNDGDIAEPARYLEMPLGLVQAAVSYYGAYPEEIDQWIDLNEQEAAEAHAATRPGAPLSGGEASVGRDAAPGPVTPGDADGP